MEKRVEQLIAKHGTGTDVALKQQLAKMAERDQAVRTEKYFSANVSKELVEEQQQVDRELTAQLKGIVSRHGWPTIKLVGLSSSENAAMILTHSADHDFQRAMLPQLQRLAETGQILGSAIATLTDKILISERKPQRFGTQFDWSTGVAEMLPVEDPANLEKRRDQYLLPPIAEYKKLLGEMYGVKVK